MRINFVGNFRPSFSTESHVAASMEALGHEVVRLQEDEVGWDQRIAEAKRADLWWWTQTWDYAHHWDQAEAAHAVRTLNDMLPTVSYHLDLWWGLARADQLEREPFFRTRSVFTADGDHPELWEGLGIAHHWMPPAVYGGECQLGVPRSQYLADIAFVGSWRGYGHDEWAPHRRQLLDWLRRHYGARRVAFWPKREAVRGLDLNDLYASTKIVIGDSCFADRSRFYWSDRAPETVGRGGFLLMPYIEGLALDFIDGEHLRFFEHGDFAQLRTLIDHYLRHGSERDTIREQGQAHVAAHHTYAHRVQAVLNEVL